MRELKHIKKESVVNCDNCITCGQDRNFDHIMHHFYDCEVAKVIMLAMTRQVEKMCNYNKIIKGTWVENPKAGTSRPMQTEPTDMQKLCIFMNLPGICRTDKNNKIATIMVSIAQNAIADLRRSTRYRPSLEHIQEAATNRITTYRNICQTTGREDLLPPTLSHDILEQIGIDRKDHMSYDAISRETFQLTKRVIPALLADEAAGKIYQCFNAAYVKREMKLPENRKRIKAEKMLLDRIKSIEEDYLNNRKVNKLTDNFISDYKEESLHLSASVELWKKRPKREMALSILELDVGEIEEILLKEDNFRTIAVEATSNKHGRRVMENNKTFDLLNLLK